jgi:transcriptional regulator with XRE-family HTH domain
MLLVKASSLLRQARRQAGLTLRQLAVRSGIGEARISDYEHDRHQPSVAMLQKLLDAAGFELVATPKSKPRADPPDPERNARLFVDVLSLADAVPFADLAEGGRPGRPAPPTWAQITRQARVTGSSRSSTT